MNGEMLFLAEQIKDAFEGDPWFGRNAKALLSEIDERIASEKPNGQHSIVELLWHIINWREFTISRFKKNSANNLHYFEINDWRAVDHSNKSLWQQGLQRFQQTQDELIELLQQQNDELLNQNVEERNYNYRKLLNGILQHDIYHLGQIAYLKKLLK
jgi:uncharacterized damage-inducible protein DinB